MQIGMMEKTRKSEGWNPEQSGRYWGAEILTRFRLTR